jgi:predicted phosphodiesterase
MNPFASALSALQEAFAAQGGAPSKWTKNVVIGLRKRDTKSIYYVRVEALTKVLGAESLQALTDAGLLVNDGVPVAVRLGKTVQKAVGVAMDELREKASASEKDQSKLLVLDRQVKSLQRELKVAREQNARDDAMASLLEKLTDAYGGRKATGASKQVRLPRPSGRGRALAGVPTLFLSDLHWGEVVNPAEVEYFNEYNLSIARRRLARVFDKSQELLLTHQSGQKYEGFVCALGGDMLSGDIHDELRWTNEIPTLDAIMDLADNLSDGLCQLSDSFETVYVPCVVGNHGRKDRKPSAKLRVRENFDWLLYRIVERIVTAKVAKRNRGNCNISFDIPESADLRYDVYNTRYLLTHGDQFNWSGGIGGIFPGLMKTDLKKRVRQMVYGRGGFDVLLMGHWHTLKYLNNIIVNGTLKGIDEYTYVANFEVEGPRQGMWTTHPALGIIDFRAIFADEPVAVKTRDLPAPISWRKNA